MLLSYRTPFSNEVWPVPIEAVIGEVDREWLRSTRRNQDEEAVMPSLKMAMAGLYSAPAIFHWGRHRPLWPRCCLLLLAWDRISANPAVQGLLRGGPQWAGYLPVSTKAGRTAAFSFDECILSPKPS